MASKEPKDLSELPVCSSCGTPIFKHDTFHEREGLKLPWGLTQGNVMMVVFIHGVKRVVCANCRYDKFGAW